MAEIPHPNAAINNDILCKLFIDSSKLQVKLQYSLLKSNSLPQNLQNFPGCFRRNFLQFGHLLLKMPFNITARKKTIGIKCKIFNSGFSSKLPVSQSIKMLIANKIVKAKLIFFDLFIVIIIGVYASLCGLFFVQCNEFKLY